MNPANPKSNITSGVASATASLAQKIARQVANEPFEILRQAGSQVRGVEQANGQNINDKDENGYQSQVNTNALQERDKLRSQRLIEALQKELRDRTKDDLIKSLQTKIANGEDVYLENYPQLTQEERDMLKRQIEMVKIQKQQMQNQSKELIEPATKKGRRLFNFGAKTQARRQERQTENPVPPSG